MKIINLTEGSKIYTSNVFLVMGTWNTMSDVNTLIDSGRDRSIVEKINGASTGVGKHKVDQIILTHSHYDHAEILGEIKKEYNAKTFAFSSSLNHVDQILRDGQGILIGDEEFEVIHMPGHSSDSICLYSKASGTLFAGDSPLVIQTNEGSYEEKFVKVIERIATLDVRIIYFGHGKPLTEKCNEVLKRSLKNIQFIQN